jgi:HSP20 family protein
MTMTLTSWTPVAELPGAEIERLNRMFDSAFADTPLTTSTWAPPVDIYENQNKDVVVKVELPEMKREEITVTFENNLLSIEGERKLEAAVDRDRYHRLERGYGAFRRAFRLPPTIDAARVDAAYKDGVLTITMPRREETRPRQIPVSG